MELGNNVPGNSSGAGRREEFALTHALKQGKYVYPSNQAILHPGDLQGLKVGKLRFVKCPSQI